MLLAVYLPRLIPPLAAVLFLLLEVIEVQQIRLEGTLGSHLMHALDLRWDELDPNHTCEVFVNQCWRSISFLGNLLQGFDSLFKWRPFHSSEGLGICHISAPDQFSWDFPVPPHPVLLFADLALGRDVGFACAVLNKTRRVFWRIFMVLWHYWWAKADL